MSKRCSSNISNIHQIASYQENVPDSSTIILFYSDEIKLSTTSQEKRKS